MHREHRENGREQDAHGFEADAPPDHLVDAVAGRQPRGAVVAGHVADRADREPHAVFGGAAIHQRDDDVRPAAQECKEGRGPERAVRLLAGPNNSLMDCSVAGDIGRSFNSGKRARAIIGTYDF